MRCFHLTWSARGRCALFPDESDRRAAVRAIARVVGEHVVVFCVVDDHVHVVLLCAPERVRLLARFLLAALRAVASVELDPVHIRPIQSRMHLETVVHEYVLGQVTKHGLRADGALWSGSSFQDMVSARVLPGLKLRLWDALPRYRLRLAYAAVGLEGPTLVPADAASLRTAGAARLVEAAAASAGVGPALGGNRAAVAQARVVTGKLAAEAGLCSADLAHALGIGREAVSRLRHREVPPGLVHAARLQVALQDRVRGC